MVAGISVARPMVSHEVNEISGALITAGEMLIEMYKEAQIKGKKYDFLILDIVIPNGMSGDETLKEILSIDPSVKAIVSSGYSSNPVMSDYEHFGFAGVLAKPYTVGELKKAIADIEEL